MHRARESSSCLLLLLWAADAVAAATCRVAETRVIFEHSLRCIYLVILPRITQRIIILAKYQSRRMCDTIFAKGYNLFFLLELASFFNF